MLRRARAPLETFLWSRAAIWLVALLAYAVLEARYAQPLHPPTNAPETPQDAGWGVDLWARWDGGWFVHVARDGYGADGSTAFFPAYPLVVRAVGRVLGGHDVVGAVAVSLAACAVAFVLLAELARELAGAEAARRSLLFLALFPTAFFLGAAYSESLYLALTLAAFLAALRGRWAAAGVAAGLAILTRPTGIVLLPALGLAAWRSERSGRALAGLALALPIAAAWPAWLAADRGRPFAFLDAEREQWHRHLSAAGPFGGAWRGLRAGWNGIVQLVAGGHRFPAADDAMQAAALELEYLVAAVLIVVLGVVAWRRLGAAYGIFVLGSVAIPLSSPSTLYPLLSMSRFALGVFPIFVALGAVVTRPRPVAITLGVFALLLGLNLARWVEWQFVA